MRSIQINDDPSNDDHALKRKFKNDEFLTKTDSSIVKNNQHNDFNNNFITNVRNIEINDTPTNDNHVIKKISQ